jgi:hypothetical protein
MTPISKMETTEPVTNNHTLTAVEWLLDEWPVMKSQIPPYIIEQAKAMEREQSIKDYNAGYDDAQCNHINDAENYANEREYVK